MRVFQVYRSADAPGGGESTTAPSVELVAPTEASAPASAPAEPVAEPAPPPSPSPEPWNGEVDHLPKRPWFNKLDEGERNELLGGFKTKSTNLERGYNAKFSALAEEKRAWESTRVAQSVELDALKQDLALFKDVFGGTDAEMAERYETEKQAILAKHQAELEDVKKPLLSELEELRAFRSQVDSAKKAEYDAGVAKMADDIKNKYGDILAHPEADAMFQRLVVGAEFDFEDAAKLVRSKHDLRPAKLPAAAEFGSRGDGPTSRDSLPEEMPWEERIRATAARAARKLGY